MKSKVLFFCLLFASSNLLAQTKNLLSGRYDRAALSKILVPAAAWKPFPKPDDRAGWSKADQEMLKAYLKTAESYLNYKWPYIPATKSLLIERTGDRNEFQSISYEKRRVLATLLLAEIYENKGRFLDQIIDGVWSICEESWWGAP